MNTLFALAMTPFLCMGIGVGNALFDRDSREWFVVLLFVVPAVLWGWLFARGRARGEAWNRWTAGILIAFMAGVIGGAAIALVGPAQVRRAAESVRGGG